MFRRTLQVQLPRRESQSPKGLALLMLLLTISGCAHRIAFHDTDTSWHYQLGSEKYDAGLVVVVGPATLDQIYSFRSAMAGGAHRWDVQTGEMLAQVADVEFPQMFQHYERTTTYKEPTQGSRRLTLVMDIPDYKFQDFHATVTVRTIAYGPNKLPLFEKNYTMEGVSQGGKVFGAGAFGMMSAVRQSSLDAYKKIFEVMRRDVVQTLSNVLTIAELESANSKPEAQRLVSALRLLVESE